MPVAQYRVPLILVSVGFAACLLWLAGADDFHEKTLHRWRGGIYWTYLPIFTVAAVLTLRRQFARPLLAIPVCILLGLVAAPSAHQLYFFVFEPERFLSAFRTGTISSYLSVLGSIAFVSLGWLFGAFVGGVYVALNWLFRRLHFSHA